MSKVRTAQGTRRGKGISTAYLFASLHWKRAIRSASFGRKLAVNLFLGLFGLVMLFYAALIGWMTIPLLKAQMPGEDPFGMVCSAGLAWMAVELALRMFFLKGGTMQVRPLLILPIRRASIVHYVLAGSVLSYFLLAVSVLLLALGTSLVHHGYVPLHVTGWCLGLLLTSVMLGQLSLLAARRLRFLVAVLTALALVSGAHALGYMDVFHVSRRIFLGLYAKPWLGLVPLGVGALIYGLNFRAMRSRLYQEDRHEQVRAASGSGSMAWTGIFGSAAPFIRLDLRMIWRNKRPRSTLLMSVLFVFYGLIVKDPGNPKEWPMLMFFSFFITGFLVLNFGQYVPAWDSAYYPLLMTQDCTIRQYLRSKVLLLRTGVLVMSLFALPYAVLDRNWALPLLVNMLYNLGITVPMVMFFGSFNTSRIDLGRSAFGNWQGVNAGRFLLVLLIMGPTMAMVVLLKTNYSAQTAMAALAGLGLAGL